MLFRSARRRRPSNAPQLESLEQRALLTTFTVTSLADNLDDDGETTLREALALADDGSDHSIRFADGLSGVISLQLGELNISSPPGLDITGNGRDDTVIDAEDNSDIFSFTGSSLTLRSLTLRGSSGSGIVFGGTYYETLRVQDALITGNGGVGVGANGYNYYYHYEGNVIVENSTISGNANGGVAISDAIRGRILSSEISDNTGAGVSVSEGPGRGAVSMFIDDSIISNNTSSGVVLEDGQLTIHDSVISGNEATTGGGINVQDHHGLTVSRSTITGNTATGDGGGIYVKSNFIRDQFDNLTISGNTATRGGGAFVDGHVPFNNSTLVDNTATSEGGGLYFSEPVTAAVESNIIARNTAQGADSDLVATSSNEAVWRNNFIGTNAGSDLTETGSIPDVDGNFVGGPSAVLDPELSPASTAGLHQIFRPQTDSPVVSRGNNALELDLDQLQLPRSVDGGVDIGAVESVSGTIVIGDTSVVEGDSGTVELTFEVELSESTSPFTVDVAAVSGSATVGVDFQNHSETLSFDGTLGEKKLVTVLVNGDADFEPTESVLLRFSNISDGSIDLPNDAPGLIVNDDTSDNIRLEGSKLIVTGTSNDDTISITRNGQFIDVLLNDESGSFADADVNRIEIDAGAGDDSITIIGTSESATIMAGDGDDTVQSGPGKDWIYGGPGNDSLFGGDTRDIIRGEAGNDSILGEGGDDVLRGGDGLDTIIGGDGNDLAFGEDGDDVIEGGVGNDKLRSGGGNDTLRGGDGVDSIAGGGGHDLLNGGDDADIVSGNNGADRMNGGNGNDYMNAGAGQDTVAAGDGDDTLLGREGNDVLLGENGNDFLNGLTERDILYGGEGEDTLQGRAAEDLSLIHI